MVNVLLLVGLSVGTVLFVLLGYGVYFAYIKKSYLYDVDVREERKDGLTVLKKDVAKAFVDEKGVRKFYLKGLGLTWQPPTLDCIEAQANGRSLINVWRDINGELHSCRFTRKVPVVFDNDQNLAEVATFQVIMPDGTKKRMGYQEIIFSPDNKSNRFWAVNELKSMWHRHKERDWWQKYGGITVIGIVFTAGVLALLLTGWFILKMTANNVGACSSAVEMSNSYLSTVKSLVIGGS